MSSSISWEQAVRRLRSMPEQAALVRDAYLDEDNLAAAQRFAASEEFKEVLSILERYIESKRPYSILDIGAGNGIAAYAFAEAGHNVCAVEPDPSDDVGAGAIRRLSKISGFEIKMVEGSGEEIAVPDGSMDVVYVRQALHHANDLGRVLRESYRVLKKGGFLLAAREHVADNERQLQEFLKAHPLHGWYGGEHAYRLDEYINVIKSAGFEMKLALGPFNSVINYSPLSTEEFNKERIQYMQRILGRPVGGLIASRSWFKRFYIWYRSRMKTPGRLYSFLAKKNS